MTEFVNRSGSPPGMEDMAAKKLAIVVMGDPVRVMIEMSIIVKSTFIIMEWHFATSNGFSPISANMDVKNHVACVENTPICIILEF